MALDPFIAELLKTAAARPPINAGSPQVAREMLAAMRPNLGKKVAMLREETVTVPTRAGTIPARLLVPPRDSVAGLIVYLHGGGWVLGEIEDYETLAGALAAASGCAVLVPGYRLAPEHPFPAGLEDAEDALIWAADDGMALLGARVPLVVGGDSAGANLATVALRRLGDRVRSVLQFLIYPVCDSDMTRPSYRNFGTGMVLEAADMTWFLHHYAPACLHESPNIAPLRAADLSGHPPTIITLASHDVLHDEGRAYATALRAAGVPVTLRVVNGVTHGFIRLHNLFDLAAAELSTLGGEIAASCHSVAKS